MALNLRAKISEVDKFVIYDRNTDATAEFADEVRVAAASRGMAGNGIEIEIVNSPREVAENSVSKNFSIVRRVTYDEYVLSMIQVGGLPFRQSSFMISQIFLQSQSSDMRVFSISICFTQCWDLK